MSWSFPFLSLLCASAGCALGELFYRHRIIAGLLGGLMGSLSMLFTTFTNILEFNAGLWGDLPWLLPVLCLAVSVLCLMRARKTTMTAVVR